MKYVERTAKFDFVKKEKPVIYISQGTVLKGAVSFFQDCIDAFADEDVDVILSVGQQFNIRKLKNISPNIHIYNYHLYPTSQ